MEDIFGAAPEATTGNNDLSMFDLPTGEDGGYNAMAESGQPEPEASPFAMPETVHEKVEEEEDEEDEEEITFLSIWQEKRNKHLAEKAKNEREAKQQNAEDARKALELFYKNREDQISNNQKQNRAAQQDLHETIYEENWVGVSKILGDSLTKPTPGMAGHADKSNRYRKLLLQLSHEKN